MRETEGLGKGLHDDEVGPVVYPLGEGGAIGGKVDVGFIQYDDTVPCGVSEDSLDVFLACEAGSRVAGRANVDHLDGGIFRQLLVDQVWLKGEVVVDV